VINALASAPVLPVIATRLAGLEPREIPLFAGETLQQWWRRRGGSAGPGTRGTVLLWPDTFTNHFHPHIGQAAVRLLEDAGWTVHIPTEPICCGLTWISTGQLDTAKSMLQRTVAVVADHVRAGGLVLGLEPSCTAVFRSDAPELLPEDEDIRRLKEQTVTLAELLTQHTPGWEPPRLDGVRAISQVHCHHHAVLDDWSADEKLLNAAGAEAERLDSGCCGLAGNFGFEAGHLEVSKACAEHVLLPAVRSADPEVVVLADGFSCRTQIHELDSGGREAVHLAELLDRARHGAARPAVHGDLAPGDRPDRPPAVARGAALAVVAGAAALAAGLLGRRVRR
jgi:Fe-S oxidoreductase